MPASVSLKSHGSDTMTDGVRVQVQPNYLSAQSDPRQRKFLFAYKIVISNESDRRVTLKNRHWIIVDADGERHEVKGPGVVGQFPTLAPGEKFDYSSFCPLNTPWGTMEGIYDIERDDGTMISAAVGRFYLVSGLAE
jgi:ApaG protein